MSVQQEKSEIKTDLETEIQPILDAEPEAVVLNSEEIDIMADDLASKASIRDFTAVGSNLNHGHSPDKHDVRTKFNVRDEFIEENFAPYGILPNDHAALWLMSYRRNEFIEADEKIFADTKDTDSSRWSEIESLKTSAPIAPETQRELK